MNKLIGLGLIGILLSGCASTKDSDVWDDSQNSIATLTGIVESNEGPAGAQIPIQNRDSMHSVRLKMNATFIEVGTNTTDIATIAGITATTVTDVNTITNNVGLNHTAIAELQSVQGAHNIVISTNSVNIASNSIAISETELLVEAHTAALINISVGTVAYTNLSAIPVQMENLTNDILMDVEVRGASSQVVTVGTNVTEVGKCYTLSTNGWVLTGSSDYAGMLGIAMSTNSAIGMVVHGIIPSSNLVVGNSLYLDLDTPGVFTDIIPTNSGDMVRFIGTAHATNEFLFMPSSIFIELE